METERVDSFVSSRSRVHMVYVPHTSDSFSRLEASARESDLDGLLLLLKLIHNAKYESKSTEVSGLCETVFPFFSKQLAKRNDDGHAVRGLSAVAVGVVVRGWYQSGGP